MVASFLSLSMLLVVFVTERRTQSLLKLFSLLYQSLELTFLQCGLLTWHLTVHKKISHAMFVAYNSIDLFSVTSL